MFAHDPTAMATSTVRSIESAVYRGQQNAVCGFVVIVRDHSMVLLHVPSSDTRMA